MELDIKNFIDNSINKYRRRVKAAEDKISYLQEENLKLQKTIRELEDKLVHNSKSIKALSEEIMTHTKISEALNSLQEELGLS